MAVPSSSAVVPQSTLFGPRKLPWWWHAVAISVLALTILARFHPQLMTSSPRTDEGVYLRAFEAVSAGESPYSDDQKLGFYYPPPFAYLGASALDAVGSKTVVGVMRLANVVGLSACLWLSLLLAPIGPRWCLGTAGAYVLLGPIALQHGFNSGNLSFAVAGSILSALVIWRRWPWVAGLLLGLSSITKPVAPVGLVGMAVHTPAGGGRRHYWAAATGLAIAGLLTLASPYLGDYLAVDGDVRSWPLRRSLSLYRWLDLLGLPVSPAVVVALVALATVVVARRRPMSARQLLVLAITAMTMATPALWSHTLILVLPLQVLALSRAWERLRSGVVAFARYEMVLVILAAAALQFADGLAGGVEARAVPLQVLVVAVGVWAPVGLAIYVWGEPVARRSPGK